MFPIQFTYELNILISRSLQTQLAGPILFTDFPFCLFARLLKVPKIPMTKKQPAKGELDKIVYGEPMCGS